MLILKALQKIKCEIYLLKLDIKFTYLPSSALLLFNIFIDVFQCACSVHLNILFFPKPTYILCIKSYVNLNPIYILVGWFFFCSQLFFCRNVLEQNLHFVSSCRSYSMGCSFSSALFKKHRNQKKAD